MGGLAGGDVAAGDGPVVDMTTVEGGDDAPAIPGRDGVPVSEPGEEGTTRFATGREGALRERAHRGFLSCPPTIPEGFEAGLVELLTLT